MFGFQDATKTIDERNESRLNLRTKPRIKSAIQAAARLSGVDVSIFTITAAYKAALQTIATYETTRLQAADHEAFFSALDGPPEPNEALRAAFRRHSETVVSK